MKLTLVRRLLVWAITILNMSLIASRVTLASPTTGEELLEKYWNEFFLEETKTLVQIPTYRQEGHQVNPYLQQVQELLQGWANTFNNKELTNHQLRYFEWDSGSEKEEGLQKNSPEYQVFGFRIGNGSQKVSLLTHIDVVPPGDASGWKDSPPFEPKEMQRSYPVPEGGDPEFSGVNWGEIPFLVGRGTIDDKGPAITTFVVLRTLAKQFDSNPEALKEVTLELLFDTSEETDMSTPHYLNDPNTHKPNLGIVFDGMWCVRAEKGIERPTFSLTRESSETASLELPWIDTLYSGENGNNPVNQIPDTATAIIKANDSEALNGFCEKVNSAYAEPESCDRNTNCPSWVAPEECPYCQAHLECKAENDHIMLTTQVEGVQHGSGPNENRDNGANPLVSLTNFLAYLVENELNGIRLNDNDIAQMTQFIRWGWGTLVFGEKHPEWLKRQDDVFKEGNGTTYGITHFKTAPQQLQLGIDIRYAINHHIDGEWNGQPGFLPGKISKFGQQGDSCRDDKKDCFFNQLVEQFNQEQGTQVTVETETLFPPEVRNPDTSVEFNKINTAFKTVTGQDCPRVAVGGGTDAKGHPELWAAGALFDTKMGPPINFHGQNEGAPLGHLKTGAKILYQVMLNEIQN